MRNTTLLIILPLFIAFVSCDNSTETGDRENKLYITARDENGNGLPEVGLHFYLDNLAKQRQSQRVSEERKKVAKDSIVMPLEYQLSQNYPNPFNPATTIGFSLPKSGWITLQIIARSDSAIIKTLLDGNYNAGFHQVMWNGTNDDGKYVTNNVYFYQLITDEFRETKSLFINMIDPEHIRSLDCIPIKITDANGKMELDYASFPIDEEIISTDESGNELGVFNFPNSFTLVLLKENYQSKTIPVKIDLSKPLELSAALIQND